jgi:hypothetical protein
VDEKRRPFIVGGPSFPSGGRSPHSRTLIADGMSFTAPVAGPEFSVRYPSLFHEADWSSCARWWSTEIKH